MARKQVTIKEICEKSGMPMETFKQARIGKRNPKPATVGRIAAALGVDVTEIIDMEGA